MGRKKKKQSWVRFCEDQRWHLSAMLSQLPNFLELIFFFNSENLIKITKHHHYLYNIIEKLQNEKTYVEKAFKNVNCCAGVSIFITLPFPEPEWLKSEKKRNGSTMSKAFCQCPLPPSIHLLRLDAEKI